MRCGAHTGLIGEKSSLNALADCGFEGISDASADYSGGIKGILEDKTEGFGYVFDTDAQHYKSADEVENGHNGNHLFGDGAYAADASDEDENCCDAKENADCPAGNSEGIVTGLAYGIGLNHGSHKAERKSYGDGKETGEEFSEFALKGGAYIIDGAAGNGSVLMNYAGLLSENGLAVYCRHAEESDDPHPQNGSGAADENGSAGTDDVSGTDLSGDGGGQRLERGKSACLAAAVKADAAEGFFHTFAETANLNKAGADGIEKTGSYEQNYENVVRQIGVDCLHYGQKCVLDCLHKYTPPKK